MTARPIVVSVPAYLFGEFELRPNERRLTRSGESIAVGARAFDLLTYLVDHRDRVVPKAELLDHVWAGFAVEEANLTVHISALRKILGAQAMSTIPGRGYRFVSPVAVLTTGARDVRPSGTTLPTSTRPSIAVMPFASLSGDPEQDLFADGLVECERLSGSAVFWRRLVANLTGRCYPPSKV